VKLSIGRHVGFEPSPHPSPLLELGNRRLSFRQTRLIDLAQVRDLASGQLGEFRDKTRAAPKAHDRYIDQFRDRLCQRPAI
jgi:hypothetical protein